MLPKQNRALVAALREAGFADPEAELRRWADEAVFQERQAQGEAAEFERHEPRGNTEDIRDWNTWCRTIADERIEDIVSPCLADVGNVCGELRRAIDELREQVRELGAK